VKLTGRAVVGGHLGYVHAGTGLDGTQRELLDCRSRHDEPGTDLHRRERALVNRAVQGVLVATEDLRRFSD
jgi:hypothetical protein